MESCRRCGGGVSDQSSGERGRAPEREGGADIGVFASAEFDQFFPFKSPEAEPGTGGEVDPQHIAAAGMVGAEEDERHGYGRYEARLKAASRAR